MDIDMAVDMDMHIDMDMFPLCPSILIISTISNPEFKLCFSLTKLPKSL